MTAGNQTQTYGFGGNSTSLGTSAFTSSGLQNGESIGSVTLVTNDTTSMSGNYKAGSFTITPSAATGGNFTASNYNISYGNGTLTVDPKGLTVTGVSGTDKPYDGLNSDSITGTASLSGNVTNNDVTLSTANATASFANATVGSGKTVTFAGYSVSGNDTGNYNFTQPATSSANITQRNLTVTAGNQTQTYGFGGNSTSLGTSAFTSSGLQNGENIGSVTLVTNDTTSTSGNYKAGSFTITPSAASGGNFTASNYNISYGNGTLTVDPKGLTVTGVSGTDKPYDGLNSDSITGTASLSGNVTNNDVTLNTANATASFANATVGSGKTVTFAGYSVSGNDTGNYNFTQPATSSANITQRNLTVTAGNQTQTYGFGGNSTSLGTSAFTSSGLQNGENIGSVTLVTNDTTSTSGNYKAGSFTITPSAASGGNFTASNYNISYGNGTLTVDPKGLTVTGVSGTDKPYDGLNSDSITGTASLSGNVTNDDVALSTANATASFANATVGSGKTVTFAGYSVSGNDTGNYNFTQPATSSANINPASTTMTVSASTNPSVFGQSVTVTATVSPQFADTFDNGGTVTFSDGSTALGTAPLSGNKATFAAPSLVTTHTIIRQLRRRHELHDQQRQRTPDGQPGEHDDDHQLVEQQSVGLRPSSDVYRGRGRQFARLRHAYRHGHL